MTDNTEITMYMYIVEVDGILRGKAIVEYGKRQRDRKGIMLQKKVGFELILK